MGVDGDEALDEDCGRGNGKATEPRAFRTIAELNEAEGASKSGSANRGSAPLTNLQWLSNQHHVI